MIMILNYDLHTEHKSEMINYAINICLLRRQRGKQSRDEIRVHFAILVCVNKFLKTDIYLNKSIE